MYSTTLPTRALIDDKRRDPMGLTDRELCRQCHGPVHRTDTSGLCWSCMPTG